MERGNYGTKISVKSQDLPAIYVEYTCLFKIFLSYQAFCFSELPGRRTSLM